MSARDHVLLGLVELSRAWEGSTSCSKAAGEVGADSKQAAVALRNMWAAVAAAAVGDSKQPSAAAEFGVEVVAHRNSRREPSSLEPAEVVAGEPSAFVVVAADRGHMVVEVGSSSAGAERARAVEAALLILRDTCKRAVLPSLHPQAAFGD